MLTKKEVQKVANLARIEIAEKEAEKYSKELSDILGFVEKLNEADTEGIEPIAPARIATPARSRCSASGGRSVAGRHITGASARGGSALGGKNVTREDKIVEASEGTKNGIINNFPEKKDRFDKVKAVF